MGRPLLHIDIAIIGGGIAGLWALNQLRAAGYGTVLFEHRALGSEQTMASQGMIHGGVKYALAGSWGDESRAIAAMPATWRRCLAGTGKVDLRGCRVLSEDFYLWSDTALRSRLGAFFAGKLLRGHIARVASENYPPPLRCPHFRGQVYRLADLVLDVPSLVATLAERQREAIFSIDWRRAALRREGGLAVIALEQCTVRPTRLLLTAGAGNEALVASLGSTLPAMQRRPLQQVLVRHQYEEPFYGHCIGPNASPRLTVSSHRDRAGRPVWYLGGELATASARETPAALIERARNELAQLLPWLDLGASEWATVAVDRAEPRQPGREKPDRAFAGKLEGVDNVLAAWPTKLTLCPDLADQIERQLAAEQVQPRHRPDLTPLASLGRPALASPPWDTLLP